MEPARPPATATENPYRTPEAGTIASERKAYSQTQVLCGTFFGSLFCAAFMLRNNYLAFGQVARANQAFWVVVLIALAVLIIAWLVPVPSAITGLTIGSLIAMRAWYITNMNDAFSSYTSTPGRQHSNWWVTGLILLCLASIVGVAIGIVFGIVFGAKMLGFPLPD